MKPHLRRENRLETEAVALAPGDGWVTALATPSVQYFPGGGGTLPPREWRRRH